MGDLVGLRGEGAPDHRSRTKYVTATEIIDDALRVVEDLTREGQLVIPVDELEFSLRRLRSLLHGCRSAVAAAANTGERRPS